MSLLAFDVGGANLKAADGLGYAAAREFPLWKAPEKLASELAEMIAAAPRSERIVATMTGELADCFATKAEGVSAIVAALSQAAGSRELRIYLTDGSLVDAQTATARYMEAAAANWHALATFAARFAEDGSCLLIDVGGTTCDIIRVVDGRVTTNGRTDSERLLASELVYSGVVRSPICAVVTAIPWRGQQCAVAQEVFATTWDAYALLEKLPEEPHSTATADGRARTRTAARERMARMICADRETFSAADAVAAAESIRAAQAARLAIAMRNVATRIKPPPRTLVISGQGEFLARHASERLRMEVNLVSLKEVLGMELSRCAPAHALAAIGRENSHHDQS